MSGNILQLVLVEGPPDIRGVDHNLRILMFGRPAIASPPYAALLLRPKRPPPELFFDTFTSVYSVTEAYSQTGQTSANPIELFVNYSSARPQAFEEPPDIRHADHSLLHQFRWQAIGLLVGYTFDVPDLNDHPWLEWVHPKKTDESALFPFRQFVTPGQPYQPALVFWKPRFWDVTAESDIDRLSPHNVRLQLFGHLTPFVPVQVGPYVMDSMWRADESVWKADTINVRADGADMINGGAVTQDSGLAGDKATNQPVPTISVILPL
jgi:hypothetical protein